MHRLPAHILLVVIAVFAAAPSRVLAQTSFDAPPVPNTGPPTPAVRGLQDPSQTLNTPAAPAGIANAPAATFVAPGSATPNQPAAASPAVVSATAIPNDAKPVEGSEIVARVADQVILGSDVLWQVNRMIDAKLAEAGQTRADIPAAELAAAQQGLSRMMVMQLIDTKLLFADFRRNVPAEALENVNKSIAGPFEEIEIPKLLEIYQVKDRVELEAALRANGTSLKDVQEQFTEKTVAGEWLRQRMPKPKTITHDQMLAYYQDHLKEYEYPAQVRWEELMIRVDRVGGDRDAAWKALAEMGNEVWNKVVANPTIRGPVFAEVAKAQSHGFTAADGGIHDWTTLGSLKCEALNHALATLEIGQMSPGIESENGFHIVRVLERKDAGRVAFTEAQAKIRETLEAQQKESLLLAELEEVRKSARVWTKWEGDLIGERLAEVLNGRQKR